MLSMWADDENRVHEDSFVDISMQHEIYDHANCPYYKHINWACIKLDACFIHPMYPVYSLSVVLLLLKSFHW